MTISLADNSVYNNNANKPTNGEKLRADLITIINEVNSIASRVTILEDNAQEIQGVKTFVDGIEADDIDEVTSGHGVVVDNLTIKDGIPLGWESFRGTTVPEYTSATEITIDRILEVDQNLAGIIRKTTATTVDISTAALNGRNQVTLTGTVATTNGNPALTGTSTVFLTELAQGDLVTIGANTYVIDSVTNDTAAVLTSNASATVSGQTCTRGGEIASTWYYLYAVAKADGSLPGILIDTRNYAIDGVTPALFTDYTLWKQLPFVIRNDASSNILPFRVEQGWPYRPLVFWTNADDSASYRVLNAGTATTAFASPGGGTSVSLTTYVPPIARAALLKGVGNYSAANGLGYVKDPASTSTTGEVFANQNSTTSNQNYRGTVGTDSSQNVAYRVSNAGANLTLYCYGFIITEVQ